MHPKPTPVAPTIWLPPACSAEADAASAKKVTDSNVVNYLDPAVAKIAKSLPALAESGGTHKVAHDGEWWN